MFITKKALEEKIARAVMEAQEKERDRMYMQASKHDMSTIVHPVNLLVDAEYERAAQLHGAVFASPHEGYGVISEELQEAVTEIERAQAVMHQLLKAIHEENANATIDMADCIRDIAVNAAAESIQVAAMCQKIVRTICDDATM